MLQFFFNVGRYWCFHSAKVHPDMYSMRLSTNVPSSICGGPRLLLASNWSLYRILLKVSFCYLAMSAGYKAILGCF